MSIPRFTFSAVFRASLLAGVLAMAVSVSASNGGFSATLSSEQKTSAGLTILTPAELAALDQLVATDVNQARKESSTEFSNTFVARRTDDERHQAGLDRLTAEQLNKLNALIAGSVAASPKPKERPRIKDSEVFSARPKPEVHGGFSLTYGRGSDGSDFRSGSMWVDYFDPASGLGLSLGITQSKGNGLFGFYPDYYGNSPFYNAGFGYYGSPYRSFGRPDFYDDYSPSSRVYGNWNQPFRR